MLNNGIFFLMNVLKNMKIPLMHMAHEIVITILITISLFEILLYSCFINIYRPCIGPSDFLQCC